MTRPRSAARRAPRTNPLGTTAAESMNALSQSLEFLSRDTLRPSVHEELDPTPAGGTG